MLYGDFYKDTMCMGYEPEDTQRPIESDQLSFVGLADTACFVAYAEIRRESVPKSGVPRGSKGWGSFSRR